MAQTTLREYLQLTEDAINSGRVNEAFTNCQQVLAQFPELLEARRLLGEVYLKQGQLEEAQQTFDWVLTNDPENVVTYCSRALICEQLKDYDTALDCYQQAYELSRGISHIRQEFNQLSERVGQPGFIFSRAGLARLYMRGDLLPQAVQEWENVLASSPDRLDARTGLLETYWRESMYDRVEQLARQILNTVPHCLKALVLLAHVTFAQNALQAQELMQQAKALDPDLVIAREIFSDFIVSNPKDPFLPLLKQPPAVISGAAKQPEPVVVQPAPPSAATNGSTFSDPLGRWSSLDNIIEPQQDYQSLQEVPPLGNWGSNAPTNLGLWGSYTQTTDNLGHTAAPAETGSAQPEDHTLSDSSEQQPPMAADVKSNGQERPWYHMDQLPSPADTMLEGTPADSWESTLPPMEGSSITSSWEMEGQNSDIPAPPAWLDMLTRGERRQPAENLASKIESAPQPAAEASQVAPTADDQPLPAAAREPEAEQAVADQAPWIKPEVQVTPVLPPTSDEEEGFFFGPEWLKSLGAAALEGPASAAQEAPLPETTSPAAEQEAPEEAAAPLAADEQLEPEQQQPADPQPSPQPELSTSSWLDQAAQKFSAPEQNLLTTLEDLEKDLRSRGFTPLEPGALTSLAQPAGEESSLSSALAQLGNFGEPSAPAAQVEQPQIKDGPAEPLWPSTLETQPQEPAQTAETTPAPVNHLDALSQLFAVPATPVLNGTPEDAAETNNAASPPRPASAAADQVARTPTPPPAGPASQPATHSPIPLDIGLETTMKRPAVQLQTMQQRASAQPGLNSARNHSATSQAVGGDLSNKERLLKGYQYQLAGSYDDAMSEYRIIIRNAPDLLGEVISNMRALLKLAPKYSAGYRVLGDAYMRQGEYLLAMEAYNKALTMAKKAKS